MYADEGITGTSTKSRKRFNEMIDDGMTKWTLVDNSLRPVYTFPGSVDYNAYEFSNGYVLCEKANGVSEFITIADKISTTNVVGFESAFVRLKSGNTGTNAITFSASEQSLTWTSSDESIATVDGNGNIVAVSHGTAVITVSDSTGASLNAFSVIVDPNIFAVKWVIGDTITEEMVLEGTELHAPSVTTPEEYSFKGWTPAVPATMPANDMTFEAVFENSDPIIKIHNFTANKTVDYRTTITFSVDEVQNPVDGASIHGFINGQDKGASDTYTEKEAKATFTVQAKYMKGNTILAESEIETVNVKTGFFAKLKAFFRALFKKLPKVVQEYLGVEIIDRVLP